MDNGYGQDWESLIKDRMRPAATICRIEDPGKRNHKRATDAWRKKNAEHYKATKRAWEKANPDKIKAYREKAKPAIKRWESEHHGRRIELNRRADAKRKDDPKRKAWIQEYLQRPEVKARRAERDRLRNQTPERREYQRIRSQKRREKAKQLKLQNQGTPSCTSTDTSSLTA